MKKRMLVYVFIMCFFCLSIPKVVFGLSPAEQVFNKYKELFNRPDIIKYLPGALHTFREVGMNRAFYNNFLANPRFLFGINEDIDDDFPADDFSDEFISLLTVDDALLLLFWDPQFYEVLKKRDEINKLIGLIESIQLPPKTLEIIDGDNQQGTPNTTLLDPLKIEVQDVNGKPLPNIEVIFKVTKEGGGTLSAKNVTTDDKRKTEVTLKTDGNGQAEVELTLGPDEGIILVEAKVKGTNTPELTQTFTAAAITTANTIPPDTDTPKPPESELFVNITPSQIVSPAKGKKLTLNVNIKGGESINGYVITVEYDPTALDYLKLKEDNGNPAFNGKYLPDAYPLPEIEPESNESVNKQTVTLAAVSPFSESSGDGVLTKLTFEVVQSKESNLKLVDVKLSNSGGSLLIPNFDNNPVTVLDHNANVDGKDGVNAMDLVKVGQCFGKEGKEITGDCVGADVNGDDVVNILDLVAVAQAIGRSEDSPIVPDPDVNGDGVVNILDLVLVANASKSTASAPSIYNMEQFNVSAKDVRTWITQAKALDSDISETIKADPAYQRGVAVLENLLATLTHIEVAPQKTALLLNYPNPFNPETWIPYQLAEATDVTVTIHAMNGSLIRTLALGHQAAGVYRNKSRAAYWDGKNEFGEQVASGLYFYTLTAGPFSATGKMLIRK